MKFQIKDFCENLYAKAEENFFTKNNINVQITKNNIYIKDIFYNKQFLLCELSLENWVAINQITHFIENDERDILEGVVNSFKIDNIFENFLSNVLFENLVSKDIKIKLKRKKEGIQSSVIRLPYYEFNECLYLSPVDFHLIENKKFWKIDQYIYSQMKEGKIFYEDDYIYNGNAENPDVLRQKYKDNLFQIKKLEEAIKEIEHNM